MSPVRRWSSEWHRPAATNLTSTSPSLGGSSSSSMISQSLPMSLSTAALVLMPPPASSACHIIRRPGRAVHVSSPKSPVPPLASGQHGNVGLMMVVAPAEPGHAEPLAELAEDMARFYGATEVEALEVRRRQIRASLFGDPPSAYALLAWDDGRLVGL